MRRNCVRNIESKGERVHESVFAVCDSTKSSGGKETRRAAESASDGETRQKKTGGGKGGERGEKVAR